MKGATKNKGTLGIACLFVVVVVVVKGATKKQGNSWDRRLCCLFIVVVVVVVVVVVSDADTQEMCLFTPTEHQIGKSRCQVTWE